MCEVPHEALHWSAYIIIPIFLIAGAIVFDWLDNGRSP